MQQIQAKTNESIDSLYGTTYIPRKLIQWTLDVV